jgi:hypothetical protein
VLDDVGRDDRVVALPGQLFEVAVVDWDLEPAASDLRERARLEALELVAGAEPLQVAEQPAGVAAYVEHTTSRGDVAADHLDLLEIVPLAVVRDLTSLDRAVLRLPRLRSEAAVRRLSVVEPGPGDVQSARSTAAHGDLTAGGLLARHRRAVEATAADGARKRRRGRRVGNPTGGGGHARHRSQRPV